MTVDRHRSQSGGEMERQRASGGDVGDAGVRHHGSVAVRVTAAPSFAFKVQGQGPPAPGLFDLGLHLGSKIWVFNFQKLKYRNKHEKIGSYLAITKAVYDCH